MLAEPSRERALAWFDKGGEAPLLLKSNLISTVHRHLPLDLALTPVIENGKVAGLSIHAGLWTSAALSAPPQAVPVLRARLTQLENKFGFDPKGHTGKALTHALTALPHDLVAAFQPDQLEELALTAMSLADRPRPKLVIVRSTLGRHLFAFVWLPRDDLTTARRVAIGEMLSDAANADLQSWSIAMEDGVVALIRYTLDLRGETRIPDTAPLDARLEKMVRGWRPAVESALGEHVEPARAARLALRHAAAFPTGYRTANAPEEASCDILRLAALDGADDRQVRLYRCARGTPRLKIYRYGGPIVVGGYYGGYRGGYYRHYR
jgi:glutamate dehydrogenase